MKKALKYVSLFAVMVCLCLSLTACTTGSYKNTTEINALGHSVKTVTTIKLKSGDKCEWTTKATTDGETKKETQKGTYKIEEEVITITLDGSPVPLVGTIKDGKITIAGITYKK